MTTPTIIEAIPTKWVCEECGSSAVQRQAWIDANTGELLLRNNDGEAWCLSCENETGHGETNLIEVKA